MTAVAENEVAETASKEDRRHVHVRRVCLVHSSKLLELSEKNPRFAGRVSRHGDSGVLARAGTELNTWKTRNITAVSSDLHNCNCTCISLDRAGTLVAGT